MTAGEVVEWIELVVEEDSEDSRRGNIRMLGRVSVVCELAVKYVVDMKYEAKSRWRGGEDGVL